MKSYKTDAQRLKAVEARDADADGLFVYAVLTTGVVCYPSCPSRIARAENMRYYDDVSTAVADGFRHCQRCRTDLAPLAVRHRSLVIKACRIIDESIESPRIDAIATSLGISRYHLQKLFKSHVGISPKGYSQAIRAARLHETLDSEHTITQALMDAGYDSIGSFYTDVQKRLGMSASTRRKGSPGIVIRYGFANTQYGLIVVGITGKGVCAVLFGDTRQALLEDLINRFPQASLQHDEHGMQHDLEVVVNRITMPEASVDIPLDIRGTVFQEKVWNALRQIEPGHTASYADVANAIGQPRAARAVATACAANPLAVVVPCHRVVRGDGSLSGYRWGIERKRKLLDNES